MSLSISEKFIGFIVATATAFSQPYIEDSPNPPSQHSYSEEQSNIDAASSVSYALSTPAGITIIDREEDNTMRSNGEMAHSSVELGTLTKIFVLLHAVRVDDEVYQGNEPDINSMMQGHSVSALDSMWNKYGGQSIVRDMSRRYNLQETISHGEWGSVESTAIDIGRLLRRFIDDKEISQKKKEWTLEMLSETSLSLAGEDFSWGLPGVVDTTGSKKDDEKVLKWAQGWSVDDSLGKMRGSIGFFGADNRYIIVILSQTSGDISDSSFNSSMTEMANNIIGDSSETLDIESEK